MERSLGVYSAGTAASTGNQGGSAGRRGNRSIRSRGDRGQRARAIGAGGQEDALPPPQLRLDRAAADARRGSSSSKKTRASHAYERLVDRLLASPHFGERMAIFWLDLVRFADTTGYHGDNHVDVYLFRDYVIRSFNANKPFDRFTVEQLAGDLLRVSDRRDADRLGL